MIRRRVDAQPLRLSARGRVYQRGRSLVRTDPLLVAKILRLHFIGTRKLVAISRETGVTPSCIAAVIVRAKQHRLTLADVAAGVLPPPINHGGRRHEKFGHLGRQMLLELVHRFKSLSYELYAMWMSRYLGCTVTPPAVSEWLRKLGFTRKKLEKYYKEYAPAAAPPAARRRRATHARCRRRRRRYRAAAATTTPPPPPRPPRCRHRAPPISTASRRPQVAHARDHRAAARPHGVHAR
jgi:hypothetical protein